MAIVGIEPLGLSVQETAELTSQSETIVKGKLREGKYRAKKAGRRTIIIYETIKADFAALPDATFKPPTPRRRDTGKAA